MAETSSSRCERIIPTEGERRNGWDSESLTRYIREQLKSQSEHILMRKREVVAADSRYDPFRW